MRMLLFAAQTMTIMPTMMRRCLRLMSAIGSSEGPVEVLSMRRDALGVERYTVASGGKRGDLYKVDDAWTLVDEAGSIVLDVEDPLSVALDDYHFDAAVCADWPRSLITKLERSPLAGAGTICFTAARFAELCRTEDPEQWPVVFPNAASLVGAETLMALQEAASEMPLEFSLVDALSEVPEALRLRSGGGGDGSGRLVAEFDSGDLAQVAEGCFWSSQLATAVGTGSRECRFANGPMGVSFAPVTDDEIGAEVAEVDEGSAAEGLGVSAGMILTDISNTDITKLPLSEILDFLDAARLEGDVDLTFSTRPAASLFYGVELPAGAVAAIAQRPDLCEDSSLVAIEFLASLGLLSFFVWREAAPRSFIGDKGSMTCCHVDTLPQLQFAHGLRGTKLLGVASLEATPRLHQRHADDRFPLSEEAGFLEKDFSVAALGPGDALLFNSKALHFATNGNDAPSAAIYHGALTKALFDEADQAAIDEGISLSES